ncbi:collagen alpha-5(IV) chain [Silurus asotus]|uniref:Collagen alpha-5(IV) chain n=1 Tax=Silurus asotus TaxID=30991 RepID=A0AAD5AYQ5_SILAS|nr:collagen alpha-5(IV) chain [Silurus asotus]
MASLDPLEKKEVQEGPMGYVALRDHLVLALREKRGTRVHVAHQELLVQRETVAHKEFKKGDQGQKGETGPRGQPGKDGTRGPPGLQGLKGQRGPPGTPGELAYLQMIPISGDRGLPGPQGESGLPGESGLQGFRGFTGPPGPKGPRGNKGVPGAQGLRGEKGSKGLPGLAGALGFMGADGQKGSRGPPGRCVPDKSRDSFLFTRHSQTQEIPYCPDGSSEVYSGYSLLFVNGNNHGHGQDLGICIHNFQFYIRFIVAVIFWGDVSIDL